MHKLLNYIHPFFLIIFLTTPHLCSQLTGFVDNLQTTQFNDIKDTIKKESRDGTSDSSTTQYTIQFQQQNGQIMVITQINNTRTVGTLQSNHPEILDRLLPPTRAI